jgi:hypothetical protein
VRAWTGRRRGFIWVDASWTGTKAKWQGSPPAAAVSRFGARDPCSVFAVVEVARYGNAR